MTNFAKHFSDMFAKNASESAYSFCSAVNTAANNFSFVSFADTVLAVSVLLCSLSFDIRPALLALINMIVLSVIIFIKLICIKKQPIRSETLASLKG